MKINIVKQISLLAALVFFLDCGWAQSQKGQPDNDYARALEIYYNGEYQLAIPVFTSSIEKNPENYEAYIYRGNCYSNLHQFKPAEKDLDKAAGHLQNNPKLDFGYGYLYNETGKYKKAIQYLDKAISLDSKNALAYNTRGVSYQRLGNPRKAIENYSAAIKIDTTLGIAYNNRGTAVYENQDVAAASRLDIKTAIKDFDKALKFSPGLCIAMRNRGMAYSFIGNNNLALQDLNDAIKCEKDNTTYYINRGTLLITMKSYQEAVDDFRYALGLNNKLPEAYIMMGEANNKEGNLQDAVMNEMEAGIIDNGYSGLANYNIGRFYAMAKEKTLMMKYLEMAKKDGYFKPIDNLANFLKDNEFIGYKNDKDFEAFRQSVRKNRL